MKKVGVLFYGLCISLLFGCANTGSSSSIELSNTPSVDNPSIPNSSMEDSSFSGDSTFPDSSMQEPSSGTLEQESELEYQLVDDHYEVIGIKNATKKVVIPEEYQGVKVTKIANHAFENEEMIEEVYLSKGIIEIGENAFAYCSNLTHISLENVEVIQKNAFLWDHKLTEIHLSDKIISIGENAFFDTGYYQDSSHWENNILYIGSSLVSVSSSASGEITMKDGTKLIADSAFYSKTQISKLMLPLSVEMIGENAFHYMSSLNYLSIKSSVDVGGYIKANFTKSTQGEFDIYERN